MREISVIPWQPRHTLTPAMARRLMEIEAARAVVEQIPLPAAARVGNPWRTRPEMNPGTRFVLPAGFL